MRVGRLNKRVTFQTRTVTTDEGGGEASAWSDALTVWGEFVPERGRERLAAGRLEAALGGVLRVRSSSDSRAITEGDRVVIDGEQFNILSIANPDQRNDALEMSVEKGGAT